MNYQRFYEQFFLMYLYEIESIKTSEMEPLLKKVDHQLINNIISNRHNKTSIIALGYLKYDDDNGILSITARGKKQIENDFK